MSARKIRPRVSRQADKAAMSKTSSAQPSGRSVEKDPSPQDVSQFQQALESAHASRQDLQLIAALNGVDYQSLLMCIVKEIGWLGLARCLRARTNFIECVTANVNFAAILACAGGAVTGGGFSTVEAVSSAEGQF